MNHLNKNWLKLKWLLQRLTPSVEYQEWQPETQVIALECGGYIYNVMLPINGKLSFS